VCFFVTILVSAVTKPATREELKGLVWGATEMPKTTALAWYQKPGVLAVIVAIVCIILNIWYR
jgi:hypothetical protein